MNRNSMKRVFTLALAMCLFSSSIIAYADYQYGVDWRGPYTTSVKGEYCDHSITFYEMEYLNGSYRTKANTSHSKYSTNNYTRLQYVWLSAIQGDTGRCYAPDGYNSYAELDESSNGGYFGTRKIYCGTEGY